MTEKRFEYIRTKYRHYIQDTKKDGEYKKGHRGTYDDFDLDKITDELNKRESRINQLEKENEELKSENKRLKEDLEHCANQFTKEGRNVLLNLR